MTWPRATVKILAQAAKKGIKLFVGHNKDSSHTNRESVGNVVGSYTRMVSGKLQALAVTVLDTVKDNLDVCSIEADVQMTAAGVVGDIKTLTGIALGSSNTESPAFPGAKRMGIIQCFGETEETDPLEKKERVMAKLTFAEVQQGIKDLNIFPHQIYNIDDMKNDNIFGKTLTDLETKLTDTETKLTSLEEESKESVRLANVATVKGNFEKFIPEGATDKQKAFMLKRFDPDKIEDFSDEGLKSQVELLQTEYSDYATMFGVDVKDNKPPDNKPASDEEVNEEEKTVTDALASIID